MEGKLDLAGANDANLNVSAAITTNTWNHIAITYTDDTDDEITIYVNGVNKGSSTGGSGAIAGEANSLLIGGPSTDNFDGKIDHFRFFGRELTPAQIAWDYNKGAPLAHWKMDECQGTTINDSAGNSLTGTLTPGGAPISSAGDCTTSATTSWYGGRNGKINSGIDLDGTDDYISVTDTANLRFDASTDDFSLFAWVKRDTTGTEYIMSKEDADNDGWRLMFSSNNVVCSEDATDVTSSSTITDTNWHFVGCTIDRDGNGQVYIDGKADGSAVSMGTDAMATTSNITLGTRSYTATSYLNGQIDDVKIFNYALTAVQVRTIYNGGGARFAPVTGTP
ncbi:MAG: LamG domain-containing protein [Candidatus Levybacteria bacterium]|nr:LamG domain-containing protein [Candidatus Levybacteria bacterium]